MKQKRNRKKRDQWFHAKQKFIERKGIDLTKKLNDELINIIYSKPNKRKLIKKQSNRISIYDISYKEDIFRLVFDRFRKSIVTILPEDEEIKFYGNL